jgi:hypothetical protein
VQRPGEFSLPISQNFEVLYFGIVLVFYLACSKRSIICWGC